MSLRFASACSMLILSICATNAADDRNTLFGYAYDAAVMYTLTVDGTSSGPYTLFDKRGQLLTNVVRHVSHLDRHEQVRLSTLLRSIPHSEAGTSDWRLVPFAVVFYSEMKPVLQVFPNMAGNDVFTVPETPVNGYGLSDKVYAELARLYFHTVKRKSRNQNNAQQSTGGVGEDSAPQP